MNLGGGGFVVLNFEFHMPNSRRELTKFVKDESLYLHLIKDISVLANIIIGNQIIGELF
jgi:hypothetical protein